VPCFNLAIPDLTVAAVDFEVACRQEDGGGRSSFLRSAVFWRQGSSVQIERIWHTIITVKSNLSFDINYVLNNESVVFQVKSAVSSPTYWKGCAHVSFLD
jgi:hypothetical protein